MARLRPSRRILAVSLAVILIVLFVLAPLGMAYASVHPSRCTPHRTPGDYGLEYRNVTVKTEDGVELKGWIVNPDAAGGVVFVIMHGYTSCKGDERLLDVAAEIARRGFTVVMFDFRAHGESGGDMTTIGPLEARYDAPAIVGFVEKEYPGRRIVLVGYSMGAVVALESYKLPGVAAVVADSPYTLLSEVVPRWLKAEAGVPEWYSRLIGFYGSLLTRQSLDFGPAKLSRIDKPVLVFVGTDDPLIKPDEARSIAAKSCCGDVVVVEGAGHIEAAKKLGVKEYVDRIFGFLEANGVLG